MALYLPLKAVNRSGKSTTWYDLPTHICHNTSAIIDYLAIIDVGHFTFGSFFTQIPRTKGQP